MIIEIATSILSQLGPIHGRESFYQKAFYHELLSRGISSFVEAAYNVPYTTSTGNTVSVGTVYIDIVADDFFIEFKNSIKISDKNRIQSEFYRKLTGKKGYLVNFCPKKDQKIEVEALN